MGKQKQTGNDLSIYMIPDTMEPKPPKEPKYKAKKLSNMTPEEIAELEKQYGCKIDVDKIKSKKLEKRKKKVDTVD